jgi:hypothetical protein
LEPEATEEEPDPLTLKAYLGIEIYRLDAKKASWKMDESVDL